MSDRDFDEFMALWPIPASDDARWLERDRHLEARRASERDTAELARMRQRAALLDENGFPAESLQAALLDKPREAHALKHARAFAFMPNNLLVLAGGVGVGKTTAATWLLLKREDAAPGFVVAGELERRGRYDKKLDEWIKERTSLVIDDLGVEVLDSKGVFRSLMDEVVDAFYRKRRTLVVTTNLTDAQLSERYGARLWSRFEQRGCWADSGTRDLRRELP